MGAAAHKAACLQELCKLGYSAMDIITTLFRIVRSFGMDEYLKLEYIKVSCSQMLCCWGKANSLLP